MSLKSFLGVVDFDDMTRGLREDIGIACKTYSI